ncbi:MAG: peptide ABC transporter substrate-binding protein [Cardiobacteriaceae bacterium]|nr:peptide ABC transporter substrate-binding protein [Cardiobacteriaceae bacterium]
MKKTLLSALLLAALSAQAETVFRRDNGAEPKSIDPQIAQETSGAAIIYDTFEGLVMHKMGGEIVPGVAEKWEMSDDGMTYTFHLRNNAKWSDGKPVTAQDFIYAWRRAVNPETASQFAYMLYPVKNAEKIAKGEEKDFEQLGIKAIDDHTLEVTLESPTPYFMELMAHYTTYPTPKHVIDKHGNKWTQPETFVSNGPYVLSEHKPQAHMTLTKSPTYWNADAVSIDKVIFYVIEDRNNALSRYRSGEIDFVETVSNTQIDWVRQNLADELHIGPFLATYYYGFNLTKEPFKDNRDLRAALSIALDRKTLTEKVTKTGEEPAYSVVPHSIEGAKPYTPEWVNKPREEQIKLAQELYAKAGYSKDKPLKVVLSYNTSEAHKNVAVAAAAMWKQVLGVETTLENQEWKVLLSNIDEKKLQMFRLGWTGKYNDPNTFLDLFTQYSLNNHMGYVNPEYDRLIAEAGREQDKAKRAQIMHDAEAIFTEDYAMAPVYYYVNPILLKPHVKGYASFNMKKMPSQYLKIEK